MNDLNHENYFEIDGMVEQYTDQELKDLGYPEGAKDFDLYLVNEAGFKRVFISQNPFRAVYRSSSD